MVTAMALAKCIPPTLCSLINTRPALKTPNSRLSPMFPQLGLSIFSPWNGLRHLGISIRRKSLQLERKRTCKGKAIYASLFGVGAPEALVIGVVALLVFGPKGLAEVARNLGKTLRTFQPTIRELQDVSREFKSSLEREIGLDDVQRSPQNTYTNTNSTPSSISSSKDSEAGVDPTADGAPSPNRAYASEEYLKITEEQLKASAARQERQPPSPPIETQFEQPRSHPQGNVEDAASQMPQPQKPDSDKRNLV